MDDDPVLRSLADDLERDDPRLAALLDGRDGPPAGGRGHTVVWALPVVVLLALPLFLPLTTVLGVLSIVLIVCSPLAVCWLIS
jgi:hypothetical protein